MASELSSTGTCNETTQHRVINVGSRCSELALCQTNLVIDLLKSRNSNLSFNVIKMSTKGDEILDKSLSKIGGKSLFTKELEVALADHRVDFVVHSLKDLPTTLPPGLAIGAVIKRHDPRDCVVLHTKHRAITRLSALPAGSVLGTSSLRRVAQLSRNYPQLKFENIRGNLNTRLRKLDTDNKYDGIVLAAAGIERLGWGERVNMFLGKQDMLYAVSQGAMAVEVREGDTATVSMLSQISHTPTAIRITAERTFMRVLDGGCSVPIGTWSELDDNSQLTLSGTVLSCDGSEMLFSERSDLLPPSLPPTHLCSIDMLHRPGRSIVDPLGGRELLERDNLVLHPTGIYCNSHDMRRFDVAEGCGNMIAERLEGMGAREVLKRARESGFVINVNQAPQKNSDPPKLNALQKRPSEECVTDNNDDSPVKRTRTSEAS